MIRQTKIRIQRTIHLGIFKAGLLRRGNNLYTRVKHNTLSDKSNPRTQKQQANRKSFKRILDMWGLLKDVCRDTFEDVDSQHSTYRSFLQSNLLWRGRGYRISSVVISRGTLKPIQHQFSADRALLITDIRLGNLHIDSSTTIGTFSEKVVADNRNFRLGDELTLVVLHENWKAEDCRLILNPADQRQLLSVVPIPLLGHEGCLAMSLSTESTHKVKTATFYHTRNRGTSHQHFSTQRLQL